MRYGLFGVWMLLGSVAAADTQVSVGVWLPGISIGINLPAYPQFVVVPGYPVYYAPRLGWNYFFYDGMYWVFADDTWYTSYWYNGPWMFVGPEYVPLYVLRVPVRYYVRPPVYFLWWRQDAPPRWGEHWGPEWERRRPGWDRWSRHVAPPPAPLPLYQQQYTGERYPRFEEQQELHQRVYRYQPRDTEVRSFYQQKSQDQRSQAREQEPRSNGPRWRTVTVPPPQAQPSPESYRDERDGRGRQREAPRVDWPSSPPAESQPRAPAPHWKEIQPSEPESVPQKREERGSGRQQSGPQLAPEMRSQGQAMPSYPGHGAKPRGEGAVQQTGKPPQGKGRRGDPEDGKDEAHGHGQGHERDE